MKTLAKKVFAIMRDMTPVEGWNFVSHDGDDKTQIVAEWSGCDRQSALDLTAEFMLRFTKENHEQIDADIASHYHDGVWDVECALVVDAPLNELMHSTAALLWSELECTS